ncbi:hypothetical protein VN12_16590 [Pirellula sp. SH-Sr6A]|nr:hypothetical protein VN12_06340 [Pirellula sp. SH-Sr6A]AMV33749.1 hypothetical protein VN12_16590 [Pirellula sp. SH-Sr6A]
MAVVTRWFSTTSAGAGDGTSWADRAQLVSGATWSSVITGFNFSLGDSLECRIGPGTYAYTATLTNASFTTPPTRSNRIYIIGSDSWGMPIQPSGWISPVPIYPSTNYPLFTSSSGVGLFGVTWLEVAFIKAIVSSNGSIIGAPVVMFCDLENTASHASARCFSITRLGMHFVNNKLKCSGSIYDRIIDIQDSGYANIINCRLEGNASASSGGRHGLTANSWQPANNYKNLTIVNNPGTAIHINAGSPSWYGEGLTNSILSNNGRGYYVDPNASIAGSIPITLSGNMITGNATYGVELGTNNDEVWLLNNRFRNNGTADYNSLLNVPFTSNYTAAGTDADEFVDALNGDYRIKLGSAYWGKGIGAGDEPSSGSFILPSNSAWVA